MGAFVAVRGDKHEHPQTHQHRADVAHFNMRSRADPNALAAACGAGATAAALHSTQRRTCRKAAEADDCARHAAGCGGRWCHVVFGDPLRWLPPGAPPIWSGERDASKAGPVCPAQEDCLYLNVLRPASAHAGQKLPVMVWIHGGAFLGGTSMGGYGGDTDGHEFANKGIVAVSVNYRLGFAGYFSHPALDHEGHLHSNYGAMDQIAALKWVKANIASFGGDPGNVTLYGESAGGFGVLLLMVSPEAQGLFNKIIAESNFARARAVPLAIAEANGLKQAEQAGVKGEDATAAAALRALPISAFPIIRNRPDGFRPYPVLDGQVFPTQVMAAFRAGTEAKVPLIIGGNSNEASLTHPGVAMLDAMPRKNAQRF
jgi:para-nitrobenzyl esterase